MDWILLIMLVPLQHLAVLKRGWRKWICLFFAHPVLIFGSYIFFARLKPTEATGAFISHIAEAGEAEAAREERGAKNLISFVTDSAATPPFAAEALAQTWFLKYFSQSYKYRTNPKKFEMLLVNSESSGKYWKQKETEQDKTKWYLYDKGPCLYRGVGVGIK